MSIGGTPEPSGWPLRLCADGTALVLLDLPTAESAHRLLESVAERGPHDHRLAMYRITDHSLWQAAARGANTNAVALLDALGRYSPFPVPPALADRVHSALGRTSALRLYTDAQGALWLACVEAAPGIDLRLVAKAPAVHACLAGAASVDRAPVRPEYRYALRAALLHLGFPLRDIAASGGAGASLRIRPDAPPPRPYQTRAAAAFERQPGGGVVVLPCGAGKTLVGVLAIARSGLPALVVVPHHAAATQWRSTVLRHTSLQPADVATYRGRGETAPVTLVTYAMLAGRQGDVRPHLRRLAGIRWGLVVFDEVHLLPAPVFALSAALPAARRLGLSATLVREDGHQGDVLALVGPVVCAVDGAELERQGYLAPAVCREIRLPLPPSQRDRYLHEPSAVRRLRMAAENPAKDAALARILARHAHSQCLVLGQYIGQLERIAGRIGAPLCTGRTGPDERERLYRAFRAGEVRCLVLSRVGTLAVDLPQASVAIQVSGSFGSRQEEAQRLGRVLRPKRDGGGAHFYTLVTDQSPETAFAERRARYLRAQGYRYEAVEEGADSDVHLP